jgi:hypothetical protein
MNSYCVLTSSDGKSNINPRRSLNEAVSKYTAHILNIIDRKYNWKAGDGSIFVDFRNFLEVFDEFSPFIGRMPGLLMQALEHGTMQPAGR